MEKFESPPLCGPPHCARPRRPNQKTRLGHADQVFAARPGKRRAPQASELGQWAWQSHAANQF
jgi:hypothetical protein